MGEVYLCRDPELDRLLAVKLLHPEAAADPKARARFKREARSLAALNHPGIVTIYEIGRDGNQDFIAMEFVDGETLREHYASGEVELGDLLHRCAQVAPALAAAHEAGVLHRDVKPDNVMLTAEGGVKVVDFGLASRLQDQTRQVAIGGLLLEPSQISDMITRTLPTPRGMTANTDTIFGTPAYMAPEVLQGKEATPASDVYSLGVLMYEAFTGKLPFEGVSFVDSLMKVLDPDNRPPRVDDLTEAPGELGDLMERMLALVPEDRPSMADVAQSLRSVQVVVAATAPSPRDVASLATAPLPTGSDLVASAPPEVATAPVEKPTAGSASDTTLDVRPAPGAPPSPMVRGVQMAVAAVVILAALGAWYTLRGPEGGGPAATAVPMAPGSIRIAVPPFSARLESFANSSPSSDVVAHLLVTLLERVPAFSVVGVQELRDVVGLAALDDPAWDRAARGLGAAFMLRGSVVESAGTLHAELEIVDLTTVGNRILSVTEEAPMAELDALLGTLAAHVAHTLAPGTEVVPSGPRRSLASLEQYELGTMALYDANWPTAVIHLERAVADQPEFFDAWYQLALARGWAATKPELTIEAATRAVELAESERDRTLMTAFRHFLKKEYSTALEILKPMAERYPRDRDVRYVLGEALYHEGYHREGIEKFRETLRIAPTFYVAAIHPLHYFAAVRDFEQAELFRSMVGGTRLAGKGAEARIRFAKGDYEGFAAEEVGGWERIGALTILGREAEARAALEGKLGPKAHEGRADLIGRLMAEGRADEARALAEPVFTTAFEAPGLPRHEFSLAWFGEVLVTTGMGAGAGTAASVLVCADADGAIRRALAAQHSRRRRAEQARARSLRGTSPPPAPGRRRGAGGDRRAPYRCHRAVARSAVGPGTVRRLPPPLCAHAQPPGGRPHRRPQEGVCGHQRARRLPLGPPGHPHCVQELGRPAGGLDRSPDLPPGTPAGGQSSQRGTSGSQEHLEFSGAYERAECWHRRCTYAHTMARALSHGMVAAAVVWAAGCMGPVWDTPPPGNGPPPPGDPTVPVTSETRAVLEVWAMDIWAQMLPVSGSVLDIRLNGDAVFRSGFPVASVPLTEGGIYEVALSSEDHVPLALLVDYDGSDTLGALQPLPGPEAAGAGVSASHEMRTYGDRVLPTHTIYLGLRHRWFSASGRPARRGNEVELLMDGEEAWAAVYEELVQAQDEVLISTWWWDSEFELVRDWNTHPYLDPVTRWSHTMLGILENIPAHKRVVVGQFWGQDSILSWLTKDADLRGWAETAGDGFEMMGHANETEGMFLFEVPPFYFGDRVAGTHPAAADAGVPPGAAIASTVPAHWVDLTEWPIELELMTASHHQKFFVIDGDVAYVGGMNIKGTDWDSSDHLVFDHRRMPFGASVSDREDVMDFASMPDTGPRKDYMVRVEGPAAMDVADVFSLRWNALLAAGVDYSEHNTEVFVNRNIGAVPGGLQIQITTTLPAPWSEHSIAETWLNAINNAEEFIFIEDQYFRMPMLNDAIAARMNAVPGLRLIVVTKPVDEVFDPGCVWTHASDTMFETAFPNRYMTLRMASFEAITTTSWLGESTEGFFVDLDIHSKLLIVDDRFMSVGSANKNNRGLVYEGEMNVAVLDEVWVRDARRRVLSNMLGTPVSDDPAVWWQQLADAATWNEWVLGNWAVLGFEIDLQGDPCQSTTFPSVSCTIWSSGRPRRVSSRESVQT